MMKHVTQHECASVTKTMNECFERQIIKLKKMIKKLKKVIEKTKDTIEKKHLNKDNDQTVGDRDLNLFFTRNQRFFKAKIKQKNEIDDIN